MRALQIARQFMLTPRLSLGQRETHHLNGSDGLYTDGQAKWSHWQAFASWWLDSAPGYFSRAKRTGIWTTPRNAGGWVSPDPWRPRHRLGVHLSNALVLRDIQTENPTKGSEELIAGRGWKVMKAVPRWVLAAICDRCHFVAIGWMLWRYRQLTAPVDPPLHEVGALYSCNNNRNPPHHHCAKLFAADMAGKLGVGLGQNLPI